MTDPTPDQLVLGDREACALHSEPGPDCATCTQNPDVPVGGGITMEDPTG